LVHSDLNEKIYPFEVEILVEEFRRHISSGISGRTDSGRSLSSTYSLMVFRNKDELP
jgi:hypothetical protein